MRGRTLFTRVSLLLLGGCTAITGASSLEIGSDEASVTPGDDAAPPSNTTTGGDSSIGPGAQDGGETESSTGDGSTPDTPDGADGYSGPITETHDESLNANEHRSYGPIAVQPGTSVDVKTTGSGDVDLYINFGGPANEALNVCGSSTPSPNESCKKTAPSGNANLWVYVVGFSDSTFTLTITYQPKL